MNTIGLISMLLAHYITGRGILKLFRVEDSALRMFCLAMMISIPVLSFVPCVAQLLDIPINKVNIGVGIALLTGLAVLPLLVKMKRPQMPKFTLPAIYELPFILIFLINLSLSVWKCFYFPVNARDMLSGPEVIAEFTVKEGTMLNSVFSVDLATSNNYFKSPFITCLQIIYKLLVHPFGQLWLSILAISFMVWTYTIVRERLHPLIAAVVFFVFLIEPEFFAYTYIVLYDFSNTVFFFCGFYFLARYFEKEKGSDFAVSAFCFGLATYIRTETLVLVGMTAPLLSYYFYRRKTSLKLAVARIGSLILVPVLFSVVCMQVFVYNFIPVQHNLGEDITSNFFNLAPLFTRLKQMATVLIFSEPGKFFYGYMIFFTCIVFTIDAVFFRRFNRAARIALYGIVVVYVGLAVVGYLFPLADLHNTSKRGLFKLLPLALFYLANSASLRHLSARISNWELGIKSPVKTVAEKLKRPAVNAVARSGQRRSTPMQGKKKVI